MTEDLVLLSELVITELPSSSEMDRRWRGREIRAYEDQLRRTNEDIVRHRADLRRAEREVRRDQREQVRLQAEMRRLTQADPVPDSKALCHLRLQN